MADGVVFDLQRFALHDGPGIRTTVFLKGCSCRCDWCHNPESWSVTPELEFYPARCAGCGQCFTTCPFEVHQLDTQGKHLLRRVNCRGCGICATTCFSNALVLKGRKTTVDEVLESVLADRVYYEESGGGVTISGGEPVLQSDFCLALLHSCKTQGIHTALQTAGNYPFALLSPLLPHLDLIMYDIKAYSENLYTQRIHGDRRRMLDNLHQLDQVFEGVLVTRTPCIAPLNDNEEEIAAIAAMLASLRHLSYYQLIPYHGLAKAKYSALDQEFAESYRTPSSEKMTALEEIALRYVPVYNQAKGVRDVYGD